MKCDYEFRSYYVNDTMMDEKAFNDYLLGRLSEDDREEMERLFFEDDDLAAELFSAEENLIESYLSGQMIAGAKKEFELVYGSTPALRHEVRIQKLLRSQGSHSIAPSAAPVKKQRTFSTFALAACIVLLGLGLGLMLRENSRLKQDIQNLKASQQQMQEQKAATTQQVAPPENQDQKQTVDLAVQRGTAVPAIVLFSGIRMAETTIPVVRLPSSASLFLLQADLAKANAPYAARIENIDGKVLYEATPISAISIDKTQERVSVPVPAHQLQPGDYILNIRSLSPENARSTGGQFYFRLVR